MKSLKKILILNFTIIFIFLTLISFSYYYYLTSKIEFVKPNYLIYKQDYTKKNFLPNIEIDIDFIKNSPIINQSFSYYIPNKSYNTFKLPPNINEIISINTFGIEYEIQSNNLMFKLKDNDTLIKFTIKYTLKYDNLNYHHVKEKDFWSINNFYIKPNYPLNANYNIKIKSHKRYFVLSNLLTYDCKINSDTSFVSLFGNNYANVVLFLSRNILSKKISINDNLIVNLYYQKQNEKFVDSLTTFIKNFYNYLSEYIGEPKYKSVNVIDLPITSKINDDFDNLIVLKLQKYNYFTKYRIYYDIIDRATSQYFTYYISPNNKKLWKERGLSNFIACNIKAKFFGNPKEKINLFSILEVNGINYLSFMHIPIIYTLGDYEKNYFTNTLMKYYKSSKSYNLLDDYQILKELKQDDYVYSVVPEVFFHTIHFFLGDELSLKLKTLYKYDQENKNYSYDIINDIYYNYYNLRRAIEDVFYSNKACNYRITKVLKDNNNYKVVIENQGDAALPIDLIYYTDKGDTLQVPFNYKKKWSYYNIYSKDKIIAFELDNQRKNLLDYNFSDNSYLLEKTYYGAITISSRLFFYLENFLIVLGSIG